MIPALITVTLLLIAYVSGGLIERRHLREIAERERTLLPMIATTYETKLEGWQLEQAALVSGSVVVSLDYFKRFLAGLRALLGGRIGAYTPLLERARREALLRMKESARRRGFDAVVNVRLETAQVANAFSDDATAGVEILAFGTALRRKRIHSADRLIG